MKITLSHCALAIVLGREATLAFFFLFFQQPHSGKQHSTIVSIREPCLLYSYSPDLLFSVGCCGIGGTRC